MVDFEITVGATTPIYRQVIDQVRIAVARGTLRPGDQLPSVRSLAESLVVNPNTIAKAYGELGREGLLESRHGQGVFIAEPRQVYADGERVRRLEQALDVLVSEAVALGFSADEIRTALGRRLSDIGLSHRRR